MDNSISLWQRILDKAERQGLSFLILLALVISFNYKLELMETKIDSCNNENKEAMKSYLNEMKEIIIRNTQAFENLKNDKS